MSGGKAISMMHYNRCITFVKYEILGDLSTLCPNHMVGTSGNRCIFRIEKSGELW